ncbi:cysteine hydrolase [Frigidibacter sp. RF13]|uniref:cysteine hydrolase family protein n=1 Tax=Frigidibacter sp. RF13 TaxID=2997340 RepID=UPI00226EE308|nr:cysteine hydrolase [Frigidibacter sp. RF13]MCY1127988.1 cysteine hydrolase [Frigidibacter sp. RF13]
MGSREVTIEARPEAISLDTGRTAVLVIDMQNDFGSEGGMFHRAGIDIAPITAAVAPTAQVLAAARRAGMPVIYLAMQHRADLADMGDAGAPHRIKHAPLKVGAPALEPGAGRVLVEGGWGTAIVDALAPEPGDLVVPKHRYSGFFETPLDGILRGKGIRSLIVTGCTTSVCVDSTIRDAMFRDYRCLLLEDCTGEPIGAGNERGNHEASLLTIELLMGWITQSDRLIAALR